MLQVPWERLFSSELLEKQRKGNPFKKLNDIVYELIEEAIISFDNLL